MNATKSTIENSEVISDFLVRLESSFRVMEPAMREHTPEHAMEVRSLMNEIQKVRRAAILQFAAASKKGGAL